MDGLGNGGLHQVHVAHHLRGEDVAQLLVEPAVAQVFCKQTTPDSLESDGSWKKESSSMLSECIQESAQHEKGKIRGRYGGSRGRRKVKGMGVCGGCGVWYVCGCMCVCVVCVCGVWVCVCVVCVCVVCVCVCTY